MNEQEFLSISTRLTFNPKSENLRAELCAWLKDEWADKKWRDPVMGARLASMYRNITGKEWGTVSVKVVREYDEDTRALLEADRTRLESLSEVEKLRERIAERDREVAKMRSELEANNTAAGAIAHCLCRDCMWSIRNRYLNPLREFDQI